MISYPDLEDFEKENPHEALNDKVRDSCLAAESVLKKKESLTGKIKDIREIFRSLDRKLVRLSHGRG